MVFYSGGSGCGRFAFSESLEESAAQSGNGGGASSSVGLKIISLACSLGFVLAHSVIFVLFDFSKYFSIGSTHPNNPKNKIKNRKRNKL